MTGRWQRRRRPRPDWLWLLAMTCFMVWLLHWFAANCTTATCLAPFTRHTTAAP